MATKTLDPKSKISHPVDIAFDNTERDVASFFWRPKYHEAISIDSSQNRYEKR